MDVSYAVSVGGGGRGGALLIRGDEMPTPDAMERWLREEIFSRCRSGKALLAMLDCDNLEHEAQEVLREFQIAAAYRAAGGPEDE